MLKRVVREVDLSQTSAIPIAQVETDFCECCTYYAEFMSLFGSIVIYNSC